MAYAIIGGLFVATLLTLLLLPALSIKEPVKERQVEARDRAPSAAL
jgi:Cu/Ag efflux pump CusA